MFHFGLDRELRMIAYNSAIRLLAVDYNNLPYYLQKDLEKVKKL